MPADVFDIGSLRALNTRITTWLTSAISRSTQYSTEWDNKSFYQKVSLPWRDNDIAKCKRLILKEYIDSHKKLESALDDRARLPYALVMRQANGKAYADVKNCMFKDELPQTLRNKINVYIAHLNLLKNNNKRFKIKIEDLDNWSLRRWGKGVSITVLNECERAIDDYITSFINALVEENFHLSSVFHAPYIASQTQTSAEQFTEYMNKLFETGALLEDMPCYLSRGNLLEAASASMQQWNKEKNGHVPKPSAPPPDDMFTPSGMLQAVAPPYADPPPPYQPLVLTYDLVTYEEVKNTFLNKYMDVARFNPFPKQDASARRGGPPGVG